VYVVNNKLLITITFKFKAIFEGQDQRLEKQYNFSACSECVLSAHTHTTDIIQHMSFICPNSTADDIEEQKIK